MTKAGSSILSAIFAVGVSIFMSWACFKIGAALGLTGIVGTLAGFGIVLGGIIGAVLLGIGVICAVLAGKALYEKAKESWRQHKALEATTQQNTVVNSSTKSICKDLGVKAGSDAPAAAMENKAEVTQSGGISGFFAWLFGSNATVVSAPPAPEVEKTASPKP